MTVKTILAAALLLTATTGTTFAQGGGGGLEACREDAQKFCSDKTGPDRRACMEANKDKLSEACKAARAARAAGQ